MTRVMMLVLLVSPVACDPGVPDSTEPMPVVRGYGPEALESLPRWTLERLVTVGGEEGSGVELHMVTGATLTAGGSFTVANRGSGELKFFSPGGELLRSVGRVGDGPTEFRALIGVWRTPEGELLAWDPRHRRATVFAADGERVREFTVGGQFLNPPPMHGLEDEVLVISNERFRMPTPDEGLVQMYVDYLTISMDGEVRDTIGRFPWQRQGRLLDENRGPVLWQIFTLRTIGVVGVGGFYWGDPQSGRVEKWTMLGERVWTRTVDPGGREVTEANVDAWSAARVANSTDAVATRRAVRDWRERIGVAEQLPAFSDLVTDPDGSVWLAPYFVPGSPGSRDWVVLASDGELVARVETSELDVLDIRGGQLLALGTDELGVQLVAKFRIVR